MKRYTYLTAGKGLRMRLKLIGLLSLMLPSIILASAKPTDNVDCEELARFIQKKRHPHVYRTLFTRRFKVHYWKVFPDNPYALAYIPYPVMKACEKISNDKYADKIMEDLHNNLRRSEQHLLAFKRCIASKATSQNTATATVEQLETNINDCAQCIALANKEKDMQNKITKLIEDALSK